MTFFLLVSWDVIKNQLSYSLVVIGGLEIWGKGVCHTSSLTLPPPFLRLLLCPRWSSKKRTFVRGLWIFKLHHKHDSISYSKFLNVLLIKLSDHTVVTSSKRHFYLIYALKTARPIWTSKGFICNTLLKMLNNSVYRMQFLFGKGFFRQSNCLILPT